MNIAVVNWRDPWHPAAGGAETYAWELARRFRRAGHLVSYVTARAPGQARSVEIEGVRLARMGGALTVYPLVLLWLLLRRGRFDVVLDCQNGIPFFTPLVLRRRTRIFFVVHHVHDRQFGVHLSWWMAAVGRFLEGPVSRWVYRGRDGVAVSPSTVLAMRERLRWKGPLHIVPNGVDIATTVHIEKSRDVKLVYVGRLVAHKRVELLLDAVDELRGRWPELTVDIVGRGPEEAKLRARLPEGVTLHGYLSEADKERMIARAWLQVNPSQGEGWGICVLEAAALGVPTVAYDVDGLRDAIRPGETGWLLAERLDLAKGIAMALEELELEERALKERALKERALDEGIDLPAADLHSVKCREWAGRFSWDRSAERFEALAQGRSVDPDWAGR